MGEFFGHHSCSQCTINKTRRRQIHIEFPSLHHTMSLFQSKLKITCHPYYLVLKDLHICLIRCLITHTTSKTYSIIFFKDILDLETIKNKVIMTVCLACYQTQPSMLYQLYLLNVDFRNMYQKSCFKCARGTCRELD